MLIDRYPPANLFGLVPKLVADFEPDLRELDCLLDEDLMVQQVRSDLAQRRPHTLTRGRHSAPVEIILRLLVVKHLYGWSYEQTEHFVGYSPLRTEHSSSRKTMSKTQCTWFSTPRYARVRPHRLGNVLG